MPGPLTVDDLIEVWRSNVDPEYARQVEADADGFALIRQAAEQLARVSVAVDRTTQALYFLEHSSQTDEPATGARHAVVTMSLQRAARAAVPLTISSDFLFEQFLNDYGPDGAVLVSTGRRYVTAIPVTLGPGASGPIDVVCVSEFPGFGFNAPRPGTITIAPQVGAGRTGVGATITPTLDGSDRLELTTVPDMIVPEQVGQYVELLTGTNVGAVRRIAGYESGGLLGGGVALLALTWVLRGTFTGSPQVGERLEDPGIPAFGTLLAFTDLGGGDAVVVLEQTSGTFTPTDVLTGALSGATFTIVTVEQEHLIADTAVGWRIMGWVEDFGITATNADYPAGGRNAMLDEIAADRAERSDGDDDATLTRRATQPSDKITPNAIRRAINRALAPFNRTGFLREPGMPTLPGFFADVDACDYDPTIDPSLKWKVALSFLEFRAFMVIEVPRLPFGEFGMACDVGFADSTLLFNFCDGFAVDASRIYAAVSANVAAAKAGGVGYELVVVDP